MSHPLSIALALLITFAAVGDASAARRVNFSPAKFFCGLAKSLRNSAKEDAYEEGCTQAEGNQRPGGGQGRARAEDRTLGRCGDNEARAAASTAA